MAVGKIKGFRVTDKSNNETGIAQLATEAYSDLSVTTGKINNKAVSKTKLADAVNDEI